MTKKHFIGLADVIRQELGGFRMTIDENTPDVSVSKVIHVLADFCASQNSQFNKERWMDYISGKCGPNGGKVK